MIHVLDGSERLIDSVWISEDPRRDSLRESIFVWLSGDKDTAKACQPDLMPPNIEQILEAHIRAIDDWIPE